MTDVQITWDETQGYGDWSFAKGDLVTSTGIGDLENAVMLSLFTDARADPSFRLWDGDPRGCWMDTYLPRPLGSHLWYLDRAKKVGETQLLLQARDYCNMALQWLLDAGIAASVTTTTQWISATAIGIQIVITEPLQSSNRTFRYSYAWS